MKTAKEGVTTVLDENNELIAVIYKDMKSRKNIFYACSEMSMTELEALVGSDTMKITS